MFARLRPMVANLSKTYVFGTFLIMCGVLAYISSFWGVFLFDDEHAILQDRSIRSFLAFFNDFVEKPYRGRPLLRLSFAINYALGGTNVAGYHALNLGIHLTSGLALFGVLRRTPLPVAGELKSKLSEPIAFFVALLWLVHPLQTQSVTYIVQRGEALMGLFYLLTLYTVIRGAESAGRSRTGWYLAAAICCGLGMASKEVMITAPLVVIVYDRIFLAASFKDAFRQRWPLYIAWALSGGILVGVFLFAAQKAGNQASAGFSMPTHTTWGYARNQPEVILHYLRLVFWPFPLCLDYAWPVANTFGRLVGPGTVVLGILAATGWALWRCPKIGFWSVWFFIVLAPTSSFIPVEDLAVEHRMYLPMVGVLVLAVTGALTLLNWLGRHQGWNPLAFKRRVIGVAAISALGLILLTCLRNVDYSSEVAMWKNVVSQRPKNFRAHMCLAVAYGRIGETDHAESSLKEAILLRPNFLDAHVAYVNLLMSKGEAYYPEARTHIRKILLHSPTGSANCRSYLGRVFLELGYVDEAVVHLQESLRFEPWNVDALMDLGDALAQQGKVDQTERYFQEATNHEPNNADLQLRWGAVLLRHDRVADAVPRFRNALKLAPDSVPVLVKLGEALQRLGLNSEAQDCRDKVRNLVSQRPS